MRRNVKADRIPINRVKLWEKAKTLPTSPGCYLMKRGDEVLYVGKAKSLRSRVVSYFNNSGKSPKTEILVGHIQEFEFILTDSDTEAFVLENNLIKKFSPRYNIRLKDDKSYPYVTINYHEPFPRLQYERRPGHKKGIDTFGPFVVGSNISEIIRILTKSFGLRDCSLREFQSRKEPCLLFQIKQCRAPCVQKIGNEEYAELLKMAVNIFKGDGDKTISYLQKKMVELSEAELFEQAAILRDYIEKLNQFLMYSQQKNAEFPPTVKDTDIINFYCGDEEVDIAIYMVRNGILLGHKNFNYTKLDFEDDFLGTFQSFILQYYQNSHDVLPKNILLEEYSLDFSKALNELFSIYLNNKEKEKHLLGLLELAKNQAMETQKVRLSNEESVYFGLRRLQELLNLKERPVRLECYDVAVFQGSSPTAAQIVFIDGKPWKQFYRYYHLTERPEGNNDFAMMEEVIARRLAHGDLPDVFVIDGGKGQVSSVTKILEEKGIDSIPVIGLAKEKMKSSQYQFKKSKIQKSDERLVIPGRANPYILKKNKSLFRILTQMRDEAHRFSRRLHHKKEQKRVVASWLDQVPGIGPKTRELLLKNNQLRPEALVQLSSKEIAELLNLRPQLAKNILKYLKTNLEHE